MGIFKHFTWKFRDQKIEKEYVSVKAQSVLQDYTVCVQFLTVMNVLVAVPALISKDFVSFGFATSTIAFLALTFLIRKKFQNYIQYVSLFALFFFSTSRLFLVKGIFDIIPRGTWLLTGYSVAIQQYLIINQLNQIQDKIVGILIASGLRYGIVIGYLDSHAFESMVVTRQIFIDLFMIYSFYSKEKIQRQVFQNYYDNREELFKFKELLADSLPQSIVVLEDKSREALFSNGTFSKIFNSYKPSLDTHNMNDNLLSSNCETIRMIKPCLNFLIVDPSSIREMGELQNDLKEVLGFDLRPNESLNIEQVLIKLTAKSLLDSKTVLLTATFKRLDERKSFEVILKKIKWDRSDAIAIILSDISYQENILSLKIANANKDKIIATVSHELRTPLHGILSLLESTEKKVDNPDLLADLSLCKDNAYLLWNLVNSIVDLHQISTNNLRLMLSPVDFRRALQNVERLFRFSCDIKGISLEINIAENVPQYIVTDENRLKQILVNLVGNAVKFTSEGKIQIEAIEDPKDTDCIQISVVDSGIGIREEEKKTLCNMYARVDNGESVNKNGAGIGLTIANALALLLNKKKAHKDRTGIELTSEYAKGSRFFFKILKRLDEKLEEEKIDHMGDPESHKAAHIKDNHKEEDGLEGQGYDTEENLFSEEDKVPSNVESKMTSYLSIRRVNSQDLALLPKASGLERGYLGVLTPSQPNSSSFRFSRFRNNEENRSSPLEIKHMDSSSGQYNSQPSSCIIVVDDTPLNLLVAQHLFKNLGYSIKTALGGKQAIELVKRCNQDGQAIKAILMDCQMPVMDGYETTRILVEMMRKKEIQDIPILAWTANNSEDDVKRCFECGMVDHLVKPTSQETLKKALARLS